MSQTHRQTLYHNIYITRDHSRQSTGGLEITTFTSNQKSDFFAKPITIISMARCQITTFNIVETKTDEINASTNTRKCYFLAFSVMLHLCRNFINNLKRNIDVKLSGFLSRPNYNEIKVKVPPHRKRRRVKKKSTNALDCHL